MQIISRRRPAVVLAFVACAFTLVSSLANAQQPTQAQASAIRQSCRSDFQAHCSGVPTGGQAALDCLKQNASQTSPACQQALSALGSGSASNAKASSGSPPMTAAPATQGAGATGGAMSPRDEARVLRGACEADYRSHCPGVQLGGGRAIACLKANAAALSPGCQNALMAAKH
jgi:Cysteine rich repeat